ncbi:hypothetical protein GGF42_007337 [Coemansia sp. RSA 2424]|nr:hypothetical protein GGF42_007337 [Coemansia sp. RSA 2424]
MAEAWIKFLGERPAEFIIQEAIRAQTRRANQTLAERRPRIALQRPDVVPANQASSALQKSKVSILVAQNKELQSTVSSYKTFLDSQTALVSTLVARVGMLEAEPARAKAIAAAAAANSMMVSALDKEHKVRRITFGGLESVNFGSMRKYLSGIGIVTSNVFDMRYIMAGAIEFLVDETYSSDFVQILVNNHKVRLVVGSPDKPCNSHVNESIVKRVKEAYVKSLKHLMATTKSSRMKKYALASYRDYVRTEIKHPKSSVSAPTSSLCQPSSSTTVASDSEYNDGDDIGYSHLDSDQESD